MYNEPIIVQLHYPRMDTNPSDIRIELFDVRAANDITIRFDFERDGWVILSNCEDPDSTDEVGLELYEVGFVPAWPKKERAICINIFQPTRSRRRS